VKQSIALTVNGEPIEAWVEPRTMLAEFLREELRLTGTHLGCEHGVCGACTLLIEGAPVRSCITYALACDGADVRTIEGFEDDPLMGALRAAFSRHHALQCGFCTPGMLATAYDIVRRLPEADETRIREELGGNLCRCTGYVGLVEAIAAVLADPPSLDGTIGTGATTPPSLAADFPAAAIEPLEAKADRGESAPGDTLAHRIELPVSSHALWTILHDVETVVRCVPGASLVGPSDGDTLRFRLDVSIGPMRALFEGDATIAYDDARRTGVVEAEGRDASSRSGGAGKLEFAVLDNDGAGSALGVAIDYSVTGPLAQFSRGPVVDAIVAELLHRFAGNVAAALRGGDVREAAAVGGIRLGLAALWRRITRWLSR
jgi:carbon-monoxide dehydrogenase small subunit